MSDCADNFTFQTLIATVDTPAFLRRTQGVEAEWNSIVSRCRRQREKWLEMPCMRLARLLALIDEHPHNSDILTVTVIAEIHGIADELNVAPKTAAPALLTGNSIRTALRDFRTSVSRFNTRWQKFLDEVDLTRVNELREGYNEFYVFEKECAGASPKVARLGFEPLEPATTRDLRDLFPLIRLPEQRSDHS